MSLKPDCLLQLLCFQFALLGTKGTFNISEVTFAGVGRDNGILGYRNLRVVQQDAEKASVVNSASFSSP